MKKIIAIALIVLSSLTATAQKIEIGLNGGITPYRWADNTLKHLKSLVGPKDIVNNDAGHYSSFRVALNLRGWQLGAAIDKFQVGLTAPFFNQGDQLKFNNHTPSLIINKLIRLPKSYIYGGVNGGINFANSILITGDKSRPRSNYFGYNGGAQMGFTAELAKGFGANIEAGARYLRLKMNIFGYSMDSHQIVFPVSLGVRYTF